MSKEVKGKDLWFLEEHLQGTICTYLSNTGYAPTEAFPPAMTLTEITYFDILHAWEHLVYHLYQGQMLVGEAKGVSGTLSDVHLIDRRSVDF